MQERQKGFFNLDQKKWNEAVVHLNHYGRQMLKVAPQNLAQDLQFLDGLGEAAYRAGAPEVLSIYQNYYKLPQVATHMARAFLMLGDPVSCDEYLNFARESGLKSAVRALLKLNQDIEETAQHFLPVIFEYPELDYPEFWRTACAVSDAVKNVQAYKIAEIKSKELAYSDANIHFNQALRLLAQGEWQAGWRLYEYRLFPSANQAPRLELGEISHWEGESLKNKKLHIYFEQGLGDCLFALRYIRFLESKKNLLEMSCREPLRRLMQSQFKNILLRDEKEMSVEGYWSTVQDQPDFWVYSLSIPYRANIYQPILAAGFLKLSENELTPYKKIFDSINLQNKKIICINWHGRIDTESDRTRAYAVDEFFFAAELDQSNALILSLQIDSTAEEIQKIEHLCNQNGCHFIDLKTQIKDFYDTAGFISCSDLVITCDTSVAHLSGALGHSTHVLVKNDSIWQWHKTENHNSTWYDSIEIKNKLNPKISWMIADSKKNNLQINDLKDEKNGNTKSPDFDVSTKKSNIHDSRSKIRFASRNYRSD